MMEAAKGTDGSIGKSEGTYSSVLLFRTYQIHHKFQRSKEGGRKLRIMICGLSPCAQYGTPLPPIAR
jgi:hypothetical protein